MPINSYEDLIVWKKSMTLAKDVDGLASRLSKDRRFELASQMRRASSSIPFNIAEGWARPTKVYINHLLIALGSEAELQTQLRHAADTNLANTVEVDSLMDRTSEIGRMLRGLVRSLRAHLAKQGSGTRN